MKLLTRTVRNYILLSAMLLIVCTPLFYFSIKYLSIQKMDQELLSHKAEFYELLPHLKNEEDLTVFRLMNDEFSLKPVGRSIDTDSLFTIDELNELGEVEPHRVLRTGVLIGSKPYQLQIRESMVSTADLVTAIVSIQATLIALLLIGLVFINRKLSKTIWGPFYSILDRLKKYQIDKDLPIELPRSSTAEFRDLSNAIAQLIKKSHEAFQSQKEFTENASHELQTPLAILNGKIDLLMQTPLSEKQAELINVMQDSTSRMARLNRNLLLLAQIENRQFLQKDQVFVVELINRLVKQFDDQLNQKNLAIKKSEMDEFSIQANSTVMEILMTNLIANAIRYSPSHREIDIRVSDHSFMISNFGEPLASGFKIFERFHRESGSNAGSGIGLAIVKKISDLNGYEVRYEYTGGKHLFTVRF